MQYFYIFSLFVTILAIFFLNRALLLFIFLGCIAALIFLPGNTHDYVYYQQANEAAYFTSAFPWFETSASITAEPLYLWYSSMAGVIFPFGFEFFLALNFVVCFLLLQRLSKSINPQAIYLFWIASMPVVFPTIFYFSPRSSLSFFVILLAVLLLSQSRSLINVKVITAVLLLIAGLSLHSQYILIAIFVCFFYIVSFFLANKSLKVKKFYMILFALISVGLVFSIGSVINQIEVLFSNAGASNVAVSKLRLLRESQGGTRLTSILSIVIFPCLGAYLLSASSRNAKTIFFKARTHDKMFVTLICYLTFVGLAVNLAFLDAPHVAGRLSRFTDYIGMLIIAPAALSLLIGRRLAIFFLLIFAAISPLIYPTLYV